MTINMILFIILAFVAVAAAIGMLLSSNAVYSALFLVLNMATLAIFYLLLNAPFIAMAQVTVYAGAIMVLFLFVIMLLGAERLRQTSSLPWQGPLALLLAAALLGEGLYIVIFRVGDVLPPMKSMLAEGFGGPAQVGDLLFNQYLLPFEVTSVLLLVAMVGAIVLTRRT
jgi:NADH-quinone oxidoreductase subunit J